MIFFSTQFCRIVLNAKCAFTTTSLACLPYMNKIYVIKLFFLLYMGQKFCLCYKAKKQPFQQLSFAHVFLNTVSSPTYIIPVELFIPKME